MTHPLDELSCTCTRETYNTHDRALKFIRPNRQIMATIKDKKNVDLY